MRRLTQSRFVAKLNEQRTQKVLPRASIEFPAMISTFVVVATGALLSPAHVAVPRREALVKGALGLAAIGAGPSRALAGPTFYSTPGGEKASPLIHAVL